MKVENWFAHPIYYHDLEGKILDDCQSEIKKYMDNIEEKDLKSPWGDTVVTDFTYNKTGPSNLLLDSTPSLQKEIFSHCAVFCAELGLEFEEIMCDDSWLNICYKHGFQHFHHHPGYDISGVYYYDTTGDEKDGNIVFKTSCLGFSNSSLTQLLPQKIFYVPKKGKLILFPSYLEHAVFHNTTDNPRVSVSFNIRVGKMKPISKIDKNSDNK